jgi:hypothetical protein
MALVRARPCVMSGGRIAADKIAISHTSVLWHARAESRLKLRIEAATA